MMPSIHSCAKYVWSYFTFITLVGFCLLIYLSFVYTVHNITSPSRKVIHSTPIQEKLTDAACVPRCMSKECIRASNVLLKHIDESVNPCDDFYSFTCGGYLSKFSESDNASVIGDMFGSLKLAIKDVLDTTRGDPDSVPGKMKIVYDSCMNESSSEMKGVSTALQFLKNAGIEKWPIVTPDFEFSTSLEKTLGILDSYAEFAFIAIQYRNVMSDDPSSMNHTKKMTVKTNDPFSMQRPAGDWMEPIISEILSYFQVDDGDIARIWEDFRNINNNISKFIEEGKEIWMSEEESQPDKYLNCTEELDDPMQLLCNLSRVVADIKKNEVLYLTDYIIIPGYQIDLVHDIVTYISSLSHRSLANYLGLQFFITHLADLNFYFRLIYHKYLEQRSEAYSPQPGLDKWEACVHWVSQMMFLALTPEYLEKKMPNAEMHQMKDMVKQLTEKLADSIETQEWITEDVRRNLKYDIGNVTLSTEKYLYAQNESRLSVMHQKFNPTPDDFLRNVLELQRTVLTPDVIRQIRNTGHNLSPFKVGANEAIDIDLGMFFPPLYYHGEKLLNLIAIGSIIGHELGHGFHHFGLEKADNTTKANIEERMKCFTDQYSEYEIKKIGKKAQGNKTVGEDSADGIGLTLLEKLLRKHFGNENFSLPGLDYSQQKLLYIGSVQLWCESRSTEREETHYHSDSHSAPYLRVRGMVQNSEEFAEVFNCPVGSAMNPAHRCAMLD